MGIRSNFFDDVNSEEVGQMARPDLPVEIIDRLKKITESSSFKIVIGIVAVALIAGYFAGNMFGPSDIKQNVGDSAATQTTTVNLATSSTIALQKIKVYITGEIAIPGVYELPANSRLADLLSLAGNTTPNADLSNCNLASFLTDGMKINVPSVGQLNNTSTCGGQVSIAQNSPNPSNADASNAAGSSLVNLNTATQSELESLPGVGPSYAEAMIDYRTKNGGFKSVEDLRKVKGIGDKRYADLKDLVTV